MNRFLASLILSMLLVGVTACSPQPAPATPTAVAVPLYQQVTLVSVPYEESGTGPNFTLTAKIPSLQGSQDPRILDFNTRMQALVQEEISGFKANIAMAPVEPVVNGSSFDVDYAQVSPPGDLLSLKFTIYFYFDGAAHPNMTSRTATYDLQAGKLLALSDLFLPGVDYLAPISAYCLDQLRAGEIGSVLSEEGALPTIENYARWNITQDGLLITFDAYQVAPYAAGPQQVTVPYAVLQSIIDPQGPLSEFSSP